MNLFNVYLIEPSFFCLLKIIGDMPAIHVQFSEICEISPMNVLNKHISTASVEYIVETQHPPLHETSNVRN